MSERTRRHVWLCADDYGISPAVNAAIRDLISRGRLNATSVMVVSPSFGREEAAALLDAGEKRAAIGLHITLTAPFQPLSHGYAPLQRGAFLPLAATLARAHMRAFRPELLRSEIGRQFEAFHAAFGRSPEFVDGHQHVQLFPQIREAFLRITKEAAPNAWVRQCGRTVPASRRLADGKALLLDTLSFGFRRRAAEFGMRTNPAFAGAYGFRAGVDYPRLFASFLDGLPAEGAIMCHPGMVDVELARLDPLTDLREREYAFFGGDSFPALLAAHGVAL
jgi:chitin disaccharide deacetylase